LPLISAFVGASGAGGGELLLLPLLLLVLLLLLLLLSDAWLHCSTGPALPPGIGGRTSMVWETRESAIATKAVALSSTKSVAQPPEQKAGGISIQGAAGLPAAKCPQALPVS
jgi:hypothetical protein